MAWLDFLALGFFGVVMISVCQELKNVQASLVGAKTEEAKMPPLNLKTEEVNATSLSRADGSVFKSDYAYSDGYSPRSVAAQVAILRECFPQLGSFDENLTIQLLPRGAEANFAMPKWERIDSNYPKAVEKVLNAAHVGTGEGMALISGATGPLFALDDRHLVSVSRTMNFRNKLYAGQSQHDIVVVPAQFGGKYAGWSPVETREKLMENEFAFGAFELAVYMLTHPERLRSDHDAGLIALGDECCLTYTGEDAVFNLVLCLLRKWQSVLAKEKEVVFLLQLKHNSFVGFGSPTCFLTE